jgi:two-component system response regulator RegX3
MERTLLIEDETSISDPLAFLLHRSGFQVTVISDGLEALQAVNGTVVDLVLLDL